MPIRGANPACYPLVAQKWVQKLAAARRLPRFCATWAFFVLLRRDGGERVDGIKPLLPEQVYW